MVCGSNSRHGGGWGGGGGRNKGGGRDRSSAGDRGATGARGKSYYICNSHGHFWRKFPELLC